MKNMKHAPNMKKTSKETKSMGPIKHDPRPTLHFSVKELPAIKEWKNGEKYKLMVEVEQMSSDTEGARFRVVEVGDAS